MGYLLKLQITTLLTGFQASGELEDGYEKWEDETDITWENFIAFFLKHYQKATKNRKHQNKRTGFGLDK